MPEDVTAGFVCADPRRALGMTAAEPNGSACRLATAPNHAASRYIAARMIHGDAALLIGRRGASRLIWSAGTFDVPPPTARNICRRSGRWGAPRLRAALNPAGRLLPFRRPSSSPSALPALGRVFRRFSSGRGAGRSLCSRPKSLRRSPSHPTQAEVFGLLAPPRPCRPPPPSHPKQSRRAWRFVDGRVSRAYRFAGYYASRRQKKGRTAGATRYDLNREK